MPASRSGNSPATKQVTGSNRICAPVPEVSAQTGPAGACGSAAGTWPSAGGTGAGVGPSAGGSCGRAEAIATSSTSAAATRPSVTATRTGAWSTVRPAWLSVVTAYSPVGAAVENTPSSRETARTTAPDCSSMKATVTPESGRPSIRTTPWIVPDTVAERKSPAGKARRKREETRGHAAHGTRPTEA